MVLTRVDKNAENESIFPYFRLFVEYWPPTAHFNVVPTTEFSSDAAKLSQHLPLLPVCSSISHDMKHNSTRFSPPQQNWHESTRWFPSRALAQPLQFKILNYTFGFPYSRYQQSVRSCGCALLPFLAHHTIATAKPMFSPLMIDPFFHSCFLPLPLPVELAFHIAVSLEFLYTCWGCKHSPLSSRKE